VLNQADKRNKTSTAVEATAKSSSGISGDGVGDRVLAWMAGLTGTQSQSIDSGGQVLESLSKMMPFLLFVAGANLETAAHQELHSRAKARVSRD
jgi:hypothetical protein